MLNNLHIYKNFWTCICPSKFHNLQEDTHCEDCLHELVSDVHCTYFIKRMQLDIEDCHCDLKGCALCDPDDYIFNEETLEYEMKT